MTAFIAFAAAGVATWAPRASFIPASLFCGRTAAEPTSQLYACSADSQIGELGGSRSLE